MSTSVRQFLKPEVKSLLGSAAVEASLMVTVKNGETGATVASIREVIVKAEECLAEHRSTLSKVQENIDRWESVVAMITEALAAAAGPIPKKSVNGNGCAQTKRSWTNWEEIFQTELSCEEILRPTKRELMERIKSAKPELKPATVKMGVYKAISAGRLESHFGKIYLRGTYSKP